MILIAAPESTATIFATWTPKHNGVLKNCMTSPKKDGEIEEAYLTRIVKSWRSKFPKSSVLDEDLIKRIKDLRDGDENLDADASILEQPPAAKRAKISNAAAAASASAKIKLDIEDQDYIRMPNSRGQMNWNKIAIRDLLECHLSAQQVN